MDYESFVKTYGHLLDADDFDDERSFLIDPCLCESYDRFTASSTQVILFGLKKGLFVADKSDNESGCGQGRLFVHLRPGNADCSRVSFCDVTLAPHAPPSPVRLWFKFDSKAAAEAWHGYFRGRTQSPPSSENPASVSPLVTMSTYSESRFPSVCGRGSIFRQLWIPTSGEPVDTLVLICHGFGAAGPVHFERNDYYSPLVELLLAQKPGVAVASLDHWGHARSDGIPFGMVSDFSIVIRDALECLRLTIDDLEQCGKKPKKTVVYGESMGGAIALNLVLSQPASFHGCCLMAPMTAIDPRVKPPALVQSVLLRVASVWPSLALLKNDVLPNVFHDQRFAEESHRSPITYTERLHIGSATVVLDVMEKLEKDVSKINLPLLILHGFADKVIPPAASEKLVASVTSTDKQLKIYEGLHHGLWKHDVVDLQQTKSDITDWLHKLVN